MKLESIEANQAESRQAFSNFDGAFAEAYSDKGLGSFKSSATARIETNSLDFGTQNIYASSAKSEAKENETGEGRATPLAQRQREARLAANRDLDNSSTVTEKPNFSYNNNSKPEAEPKENETGEGRATPLAQRQREERLAANRDLDQSTAISEKDRNHLR